MADNYLITGYWGTPHVTVENDRGINAGIVGEGRKVLPVGEQFKAEYIGNNTIRLYDGKLMDNGAAAGIPAGEYIDLIISNAGQGMKRNDLIVFQYQVDPSTLVESGTFVVVQGTETTGTAQDPALVQANLLTNKATFDQMALWRIPVVASTISAPVRVFDVYDGMEGLSEEDGVAFVGNESVNSITDTMNADTLDGHNSSYYAKTNQTTPRNLLDNSNFANPVNQRGDTTYNTADNIIDRWRLSNNAIVLNVKDGCINVANNNASGSYGMLQRLAPEKTPSAGTVVTLAAMDKNGKLYVGSGTMPEYGATGKTLFNSSGKLSGMISPASDTNEYVRVFILPPAGTNIDLVWVALYEGEYTAENLPVYTPKDHAAELLECQRYFFRMRVVSTGVVGLATAPSASYAILPVPIPTICPNQSPTITMDYTQFSLRSAGEAIGTITEVRAYNRCANMIVLRLNGSGFTTGGIYYLRASSAQNIDFSWEL